MSGMMHNERRYVIADDVPLTTYSLVQQTYKQRRLDFDIDMYRISLFHYRSFLSGC